MKIEEVDPPRMFRVGFNKDIEITHCADVFLKPDELVTFVTKSGGAHDVVRKSWGFYAVGSLNGRLKEFGLKTVLIRNETNLFYVALVEKDRIEDFKSYLKADKQAIVCWLDDEEVLAGIEREMRRKEF